MPRIVEYQPQVGAPGPQNVRRAQPGDFGVGAGLSDLGTGMVKLAAGLNEHQERQQVSQAHLRAAQARRELTAELLNSANSAQPGDYEFAQKFERQAEEFMDNLSGEFTTQRGRETYARLREGVLGELSARALAHQIAVIGKGERLSYEQQLEHGRNTLLNDWTQYKGVRDELMDYLETRTSIDPEARQDLAAKTRLSTAVSAVQGYIADNAPAARHSLLAGQWDTEIDADQKQALIGRAEARMRDLEVQERQREAERKKALEAEQEKTGNVFFTMLDKGELRVDAIDKSNLSPTGENSKMFWKAALDARAKEIIGKPIQKEASTFLRALEDVQSGRIADETQLFAVFRDSVASGRGIDWEDYTRLRNEFQDARTPDGRNLVLSKKTFLDGVKLQIDKTNMAIGAIDMRGGERFSQFTFFVDRQVAAARQAGKPWTPLFDKDSPEYLGKYVPNFQATMEETMENLQGTMNLQRVPMPSPAEPSQWVSPSPKAAPPAAPRSPIAAPRRAVVPAKKDETADEYFDRVLKGKK